MTLMPNLVAEIEDALARKLDAEDLCVVASTRDLSPLQESNVCRIARWSRPLAVAYMHEIVPTARMAELMMTLDRLGVG